MNSLRTAILAGLGFGLAALTPAAAATSAFVSVSISEWAGPSTYYPVVYVIPAGATVTMYGCLPGGTWCDVSYAGDRGWVPGTYLEAYYESQPVFVPYYVAEIGVTIVSFEIDSYWNTCYRDRPFFANFAERNRFERYAHGPGARIAAAAVVPGPGVKAHGPGPRIAAAAVSGPAVKGGRLVAHPGHVQTLAAMGKTGNLRAFAAVGPKHNRLIVAGKAQHTVIATRAIGKGMQFAPGPGPSRIAAMARPHGGLKPCPKGHACTF